MIYIYNCYGGTHSSALAAAYHLNYLPTHRTPSKQEILKVDIFNNLTRKDMGRIIYHGDDENGDKVYSLGRGRSKVVVKALNNICSILRTTSEIHEPIIFSNTSPTVPIAMTFGGMFSRGLRINFIGVPLLLIGARQAHSNLVNLVKYTKEQRNNQHPDTIVLNNKNFK